MEKTNNTQKMSHQINLIIFFFVYLYINVFSIVDHVDELIF